MVLTLFKDSFKEKDVGRRHTVIIRSYNSSLLSCKYSNPQRTVKRVSTVIILVLNMMKNYVRVHVWIQIEVWLLWKQQNNNNNYHHHHTVLELR